PAAREAPGGWWGRIASEARVHVAPSTQAPVVGMLEADDRVKVLAEEQGEAVDGDATWYRIDGGRYAGGRVHRSLVERLPDPTANTAPLPEGRAADAWIVVDRTTSTLTFVQGGRATFVTYVSLG